MKKSKLTLFAALLLALLLLCGCSFKNATLDAQMQAAVTALNEGDAEEFCQLVYPGAIPEEDLLAGYEQIRTVWQETNVEELKLVSINVQTNKNVSGSETVHQGVYKLNVGTVPHYLTLVYLKTDEAGGLLTLNLSPATETSGVEISSVSIFNLVFKIIFAAAAIVTIVDVIRKKPRRYGWYIVLTLVHLNIRANGLVVTLPLGAIIYWCLRKKLLAAKAARLAAKAAEAGAEEADAE